MLETSGKGQGTATEETRPQAALLRHSELQASGRDAVNGAHTISAERASGCEAPSNPRKIYLRKRNDLTPAEIQAWFALFPVFGVDDDGDRAVVNKAHPHVGSENSGLCGSAQILG